MPRVAAASCVPGRVSDKAHESRPAGMLFPYKLMLAHPIGTTAAEACLRVESVGRKGQGPCSITVIGPMRNGQLRW